MIRKFTKGNKHVTKKLNSLIETNNNHNRVKSAQVASSPYSHNKKIYFGEIENTSTDTFTGTFYNSEGNKVGSSSPFYQLTINGSGEVGDTFAAVKFNGEWYSITGGGGGGGSSTQWAIVTSSLEYNNPSKATYTLELISNSTEIEVSHAKGYEGYNNEDALDLRNYSPWYRVDAIVPVIQYVENPSVGVEWFINETFTFLGSESNASLRWNEEEEFIQAVWA